MIERTLLWHESSPARPSRRHVSRKCSATISHALLIVSAYGAKLRRTKKCVKLPRSLLHGGKTQRRDREVLFYSDLRGLLPSPRTFTLRDRILRIRAAALFLPILYAVIDPTYAVEAIPGEYSVRRNLWLYLEDAGRHGMVSPRPPLPFSLSLSLHITWSYRAPFRRRRPAERVDGVFRIRRRRSFFVRRQLGIVHVTMHKSVCGFLRQTFEEFPWIRRLFLRNENFIGRLLPSRFFGSLARRYLDNWISSKNISKAKLTWDLSFVSEGSLLFAVFCFSPFSIC